MPGVKTISKHENRPLTSSANQTLQIPAGGKIHSIMLSFLTSAGAAVTEAQIRAEIANIRLTAGGKDIINCPAVQLLDAYEFLGTEVQENGSVAGAIELNIGRLLFTDPAVRDLFGLGTADVASIQIQVQAGTLSAIASVEAYTEREPVNEVLGTYARLINYPMSFNSTGQHTYDALPREEATAYAALMIDDGASGTIADSEIRLGQTSIRERVPLHVNKQLLSNNRLAQPAGYFVHGLNDGSLAALLSMKNVKDFRVVTNFAVAPGAGGYNITALTIENLSMPK